jgi:hypothetical protein
MLLGVSLVLLAAVELLVAVFLTPASERTSRRKLVVSAVCILLGAGASFLVAQPVHNDKSDEPTAALVYLGITDEAIVSATRKWVEEKVILQGEKSVTVVGVPSAKDIVQNVWPVARFVPASFSNEEGITLENIVPDIARRVSTPNVTTAIVIAGPRATNLDEVRARLGQVFERLPDLPNHLHFLSPGLPDELPEVGSLAITADRVLARGSTHWPVSVRVKGGDLTGDLFARGWVYDSTRPLGTRGVKVSPNGLVLFDAPTAPQEQLRAGIMLKSDANLAPPRQNDPAAFLVELRTEFEPLLASMAFATEAKPQLLVLKKKNGNDPDPLPGYCKQLGLDIREAELNLSDQIFAKANAEELSDFPVILVGIPLKANEWDVLKASIAKQKSPTALLFVGSGRTTENSQGWLRDVLSDFKPLLQNKMLRKVAFAWDNSGSMRSKISDRDNRSRLQVVKEMIGHFQKGFDQRNTGLLEVLLKKPGWQMKPISDIGDFPLGDLEAGPALVEFARLVKNGTPFSDVVIFMDPTDVDDVDNDGIFREPYLNAAKSLEAAGCKVHFISVGGEMDPRNEDFMKVRLRLKMADYAGPDLDRMIERLLYNDVLPRLTVRFEPGGVTELDLEQTTQLKRVVGPPSPRLIDSLGGSTDISSVPAEIRKNILLWTVYKGNTGTPLLMRRQVPLKDKQTIPVTWLNTSINAEAATRLRDDNSEETRKLRTGLANLFIAAVSSTSKSLKPSPFNFYSAADGRWLLAILDTYQPFQVKPEETSLTSRSHGVSGSLDDRDLGQLRWTITSRIEPYKTENFEVRIGDQDKRIGTATETIRLFGMPPTLVPIPEVRAMSLATSRVSAGETITPAGMNPGRISIPQSWYGLLVSLAMLLAAILVCRA